MTMPTLHTHAEPALEPEIPIIDTHHHLWAHKPPSVAIGRPYSLDEFHRDVRGGHNIVASVFLECGGSYRTDGPEHFRSIGEIEWVMTHAADKGLLDGLVGYADMRLGAKAGEVLDAFIDVAGPRFKGIRQGAVWDPNPDVYVAPRKPPRHLMKDPAFRAGTAELARRDLVYEAWAYFHQLDEVADLARAQPDLRIVLCHLGGPVAMGPYALDRAKMLSQWRRAIEGLVDFPNIVLKLGGIGFPPFGAPDILGSNCSSERVAEFWGPEIRFCVDALGADRCMFESNYPPDEALCDYVVLWNAFKRMTRSLPADDRAKLFEGTARRTYRL